MSDENQLKPMPCPFCGTPFVGVTTLTSNPVQYTVQCNRCPCRLLVTRKSEFEAVAAWNTRAPDQTISTLRAELESAKAEVERLKKTYEHHLLGCAAQDQFLLEIGLVDTSGDECAGCWENALANELQSELTATRAKLAEAQKEIEIEEMCRENDVRETLLDRMSQSIAAHFNANIGEHSNLNSPWHEAIRIIDEASPTIPAALVEKLEGALNGSAAIIIKRRQGIVDAYEISKVEDLIESALADLQAFRNGGKV